MEGGKEAGGAGGAAGGSVVQGEEVREVGFWAEGGGDDGEEAGEVGGEAGGEGDGWGHGCLREGRVGLEMENIHKLACSERGGENEEK